MIVRFEIPVNPQPKKRVRRGRGGVWYTPPETVAYEQELALHAQLQMVEHDLSIMRQPLMLSCDFYREGNRGVDLDNLIKALKDAFNGVVWIDDKQVIEYGHMRLYRGCKKSTGHSIVTIGESTL